MERIFRKTGYSEWCQQWMRSYLADKTAYFVFDSQKSRDFDIKAGVPQEFFFSLIFFFAIYCHAIRGFTGCSLAAYYNKVRE
jgi:hypothetical protein